MADIAAIRPATAADHPELRRAIVQMQNDERRLHRTRRPGEEIADAYLAWMLRRAGDGGAVLLAEVDGVFAGFVAGWTEQTHNLGETADSNRFGYVSDACVLPAFRGLRIAPLLLAALVEQFRATGVRRVRIATLATNQPARRSYARAGFREYEVTFEMEI